MQSLLSTVLVSSLVVLLSGCPDDEGKESPAADAGGQGQDEGTKQDDGGTSEPDASAPPPDASVEGTTDAATGGGEAPPEGLTLSFDGEPVEALHAHHQLLSASAIAKRIIYNHTEYQIAMDEYTVSMDIAFMAGSTPPYTAGEVDQGATRVRIYLNDESNFDPPPAVRSTNVRKTFECTGLPGFTFADAAGRFAGTMECDVVAQEDGEMHGAKVTFNFADP